MNTPQAAHLEQGSHAEDAALQYLIAQGLRLKTQNYWCRYGEIDLVMLDDHELVFIEIRYRKNQQFGGAIESISHEKKRKIRTTAERYLQKYPRLTYSGCRFDVIAMTGAPQNYTIDWIKDAF